MYSSSILVLLMYVQGNQRVTVAIFRANFSFLVKMKFNPVHFHMIAYIAVVFHCTFVLPVKTMQGPLMILVALEVCIVVQQLHKSDTSPISLD